MSPQDALDKLDYERSVAGHSDTSIRELKEIEEALSLAEMEDALDEFYELFPGLDDYDSRGNWIGPVANENGWTP